MSEWLAIGAERSLGAVYDHIAPEEPPAVKEQLLRVVASRLLSGYAVERIVFGEDGLVRIRMAASAEAPDWEVSLVSPNLSAPADAWFASDTAGLGDRIADLMRGVPIEALSWGDLELKRVIEERAQTRLPGWRVSLMVRNLPDGRSVLEVAFTPEQPLTLAVTSRIHSSSVPVMLHSNLKDDLLKGFAPVIGIPVAWLDVHKEDLVALTNEILADEYLVEKGKLTATVEATTGTVSELDIDLESQRYAAWVWMAVYAGADDRYPEIGLHFGRRAQLFPKWDMELYTELIMQLDDWDLETRLGMRWSPWKNIWLGGEWSSRDDAWWARATLEARLRRPYAWIRYSDEGDTNGAVGLRINDFFSIEVHYDSRYEDAWNVRALVNL